MPFQRSIYHSLQFGCGLSVFLDPHLSVSVNRWPARERQEGLERLGSRRDRRALEMPDKAASPSSREFLA
jgi:hypothetical protein